MQRYPNNGRCCNIPPTPPSCVTPIMPREPICDSSPEDIGSLAVAFVIKQPYDSKTFDLHTSLHKGTIYPDLYKPYVGRGCR